MRAKPACDLARQPGVVQRQDALRRLGPVGPHHGGYVFDAAGRRICAGRHRQLREWTRWQEMLQRHVMMRHRVADREHHAGLLVVQAGDRNAGGLPQWRIPAFRRHHQPAGDRRSVRDVNFGAGRRARNRRIRRGEYPHAGRAGQRRVQRHAQCPRLDHPAERLRVRGFEVIEMQEQPGRGLADPSVTHTNVMDRAGRGLQCIPKPGIAQLPTRAGGNGIGSAVKGRVLHRGQRHAIDNHDREAGLRQTASQGAPDRTGANHADVCLHFCSQRRQCQSDVLDPAKGFPFANSILRGRMPWCQCCRLWTGCQHADAFGIRARLRRAAMHRCVLRMADAGNVVLNGRFDHYGSK